MARTKVKVADQERPQYVTFPGGGGWKPKPPRPHPKPRPKKGQKMYMPSRTAAGKQAYGKLPKIVQDQLKGATVGESAQILRAHREVSQMGRKVQKPRKVRRAK